MSLISLNKKSKDFTKTRLLNQKQNKDENEDGRMTLSLGEMLLKHFQGSFDELLLWLLCKLI